MFCSNEVVLAVVIVVVATVATGSLLIIMVLLILFIFSFLLSFLNSLFKFKLKFGKVIENIKLKNIWIAKTQTINISLFGMLASLPMT
jgi:ABC-type phosphate/phosphonate transport system permease subunit